MSGQQYPGSRWWKVDFHNHTPASSDFDALEINTLKPRDWLLAYMRKGIDCVAVTDHNTSGWIEKLQIALRDMATEEPTPLGYRPLVLFPGVEITTGDSLHILAVFGPEAEKSVLDGLLVGKLSISNVGNPTAELMVSESASTAIDCIHALKGLAIAAHVEKDNGLLQGSPDASGAFKPKHAGRVIDDVLPKLDGLEFQSLNNDCYRHFSDRIAARALVSGSDWPHNCANAGTRFSWVKMSNPSFDGLRLALLDPESALRRSDQKADDPQPLPEQWIESITLENMHLRRNGHGALSLSFNPAYNAIIGGRGSGKSTVLECLRLGLAREGELRKLGDDSEIWKTFEGFRREYVHRDSPGMMLPETKISVEVVKGKEESSQRFKFIWSKRSDGRFATQVLRWDEGRWQETGLDEQQASEFFPVKIFSQKQILALANNPQALLEHIDNSIRDQKTAWLQQFDTRKSTLLAARLRVRTLKKELEKKPALELEYKEASRKARVFANANFGPLLKAHQRATQQQRALDDFYQLLANDVAGLQAGLEQAANLASTELSQFLAETPAEIAARDNAIALKSQLVKQYEHIVVTVLAMQEQLDAAQVARTTGAWYQENQVHIQAYQKEAARLKGEGINSAQEAAIAVATEERLRKQLEQIKKFETELEQAESTVELAAHALTHCREELTQARMALIDQLLEQNDMLKVSLRSMASVRDGVDDLRQILKLPDSAKFEDIWLEDEAGKTSGFLWDLVDPEIASSVGERLQNMKLDIEGKSKNILRTTLHGTLVKRLEATKEEAFDELSWWFPEDEVSLAYRPRNGAAYKNINLASAGQKTAAMLSFLLVHGDEPLLLDQPEDDLDNALVSELVVEQLRKNKVHRQLLVVTHNANIVVNADAELVMTMDFNGQITLASAGGLQETVVRKDICRVMEGGEEAFRQRYKRILQDLEVRP
jgi:ABC-type molybdenum transport system ATPase subunit/photorepair protein PhrA